jgi:hypothetical protein
MDNALNKVTLPCRLINRLNQRMMKRVVILTAMAIVLTAGLMACGGSQGGHCDAYGSVENVDLGAK